MDIEDNDYRHSIDDTFDGQNKEEKGKDEITKVYPVETECVRIKTILGFSLPTSFAIIIFIPHSSHSMRKIALIAIFIILPKPLD